MNCKKCNKLDDDLADGLCFECAGLSPEEFVKFLEGPKQMFVVSIGTWEGNETTEVETVYGIFDSKESAQKWSDENQDSEDFWNLVQEVVPPKRSKRSDSLPKVI